MGYRSNVLQRSQRSGEVTPRDALRGKGIYKPGTVWVRKCDRVEFTLKEKDEIGLVFQGFESHFAEYMFRPK